jgi:hypothetical protein
VRPALSIWHQQSEATYVLSLASMPARRPATQGQAGQQNPGSALARNYSRLFYAAGLHSRGLCQEEYVTVLDLGTKAMFSFKKKIQDSPSHRMFRHIHEALNVDEKN